MKWHVSRRPFVYHPGLPPAQSFQESGYLSLNTNPIEYPSNTLQLKGESTCPHDNARKADLNWQPVPLDHPELKWNGRAAKTDGVVSIDWSLSGLEFNLEGAAARIELSAGDTSDINCTYVAVSVNGRRTAKFRLRAGCNWYILAEDLDPCSVAHIRLEKLNEAVFAYADVTALEIAGELKTAPRRRAKTIEVVGDSISAGFGVLAGPSEDFTAMTEDGAYTYGALLADKLDAELFLVAASGYGIYMNNDGSTKENMADLYELAQPSRSKTMRWNQQAVHPDLIIVNLGTNDNAAGAPKNKVFEKVKAFISRLSALHPHAEILWVYGLMNTDYTDILRQAVEDMAAAGHRGRFLKLPNQSSLSSSTGAAGHPNQETHMKTAAYLLPYAAELLEG